MKIKKILISSCIGLLAIPMLVFASPPTIPVFIYGDITIDNNPAPIGTNISIETNGLENIQIISTELGKYMLDVPSEYFGKNLIFKVNGKEVLSKICPDSVNNPSEKIDLAIINEGSNEDSLLQTVANPIAGTYTAIQNVVLTSAGSASIHYSTNNSAPSCSDTNIYAAPISVNASLTIKAIACDSNGNSSVITTFDYVINIARTKASTSSGGGGGGGSEVSLSNLSIKTVGMVVDNKIKLAITATGANMMMLSNSADFSGATWEGLSTSILAWNVKTDTTKIYIKFRTPSMVVSSIYSCDVPTILGPVVLESDELENIIVLGEESPVSFDGDNLYGVNSNTVEIVSGDEAEKILACNMPITLTAANEGVYNKIIGNYASGLSDSAKLSIKCFIQNGTQTTKRLGAGERGGVINSFVATFTKMPVNAEDWQDVIKIANGRWPKQRNTAYEEQMKTGPFVKIYKRSPDAKKVADNSAIVIMSYGLLPVQRNMNSEKTAILTFKAIYKAYPSSALDWNTVRAIAYSGAIR